MATQTSDRYTALPTDAALAETAAALEGRGFGVEVVGDLDAARRAVLARIPAGASVMTYPSVTLEESGIAQAIDESGRYDSARARGRALDRATQMAEIKALMLQPDFALGSVHAVTRDGTLLLASALGSQVAAHAWGAGRVILAVGAQKLVPDLAAARERIREHCLPLESARALAAYGEPSRIGKILEIHREDPGRIDAVLIRRRVGY